MLETFMPAARAFIGGNFGELIGHANSHLIFLYESPARKQIFLCRLDLIVDKG